MILWGENTSNLLLETIDCILAGREHTSLPIRHAARFHPTPYKRTYDYDIDRGDIDKSDHSPLPESRKCVLTLGDGTEIDLSDDAPSERPDALMRNIDKVLGGSQ